MTGQAAVDLVEQQQSPWSFLCGADYEAYLCEARRGRQILAVRLSTSEHMNQVRDLLAPYHAHHMKYIGAWSVVELLP